MLRTVTNGIAVTLDRIVILLEDDKGRFNRAKLMNIGAKFAFSQMNQKCEI